MEANRCIENCELKEVKEEEDVEILKKRISSHRLYGLLMESHFNCLKASLGDLGENLQTRVASNAVKEVNLQLLAADVQTTSELDQFMETYCLMLGNLKDAMEIPIAEANGFICSMHKKLNELAGTNFDRSVTCESDSED